MQSGDGCRVIYQANGGTSGNVPVDSTLYAPDATVTVLGNTGNLARLHYIFSGWIDNTSGLTYIESDTITLNGSDITLSAIWTAESTYSVTYNANGGSGTVPAAVSYYSGDNVIVEGPGNLSLSGYVFTGWSDGTAIYQQGETIVIVNSPVTLTAQWTLLASTISLTYNANGAAGNLPATIQYFNTGDMVTVLGNSGVPPLTLSGYSFNGWNTVFDGSGINYSVNEIFNISSDLTLYAKWTNSPVYTITYFLNGAEYGTVPVDNTYYIAGDTAYICQNSGNLARAGYTFIGWNTKPNETGTGYAPGAEITIGSSNILLYAAWGLYHMINEDFSSAIDTTRFTVSGGIYVSSGYAYIPSGAILKSQLFRIPAVITGTALLVDPTTTGTFSKFTVTRNNLGYNSKNIPESFSFGVGDSVYINTEIVYWVNSSTKNTDQNDTTINATGLHNYKIVLNSNSQELYIDDMVTPVKTSNYTLKPAEWWCFTMIGMTGVEQQLDSLTISTSQAGDLP